jgi:hypothetical protein
MEDTNGPGTGFTFTAKGQSRARNYDNETLTELEQAHEHVDALLEQHEPLIPGSMNQLIHQWRDDLWDAIEAKHAEDKKPSEAEPR